MERILNTMLDILNDSDGAWITNNHNIEGDHTDIFLVNDAANKLLMIEYRDDTYKIYYSDITVLFQEHEGMKIFEIRSKDAKTLLLHIRYK